MSYLSKIRFRRTPQSLPIAGQVPNSAGGHAWAVDDWTRLAASSSSAPRAESFYATERTLTRENARAVERCIAADGRVRSPTIVAVSRAGRAPEGRPGALRAGDGRRAPATSRRAGPRSPRCPAVARTGTHLFRVREYVGGFRGWGRALRRAVARWYTERDVGRSRATRRSSTASATAGRTATCSASRTRARTSAGRGGRGHAEHARMFDWIAHGGDTDGLPRMVEGFARAQARGRRPRRGGADPRLPPPARGRAGEHLRDAGGLGGAARGHADDGADPQPRHDDARRRRGARARTAPQR